MDSQNEASKKLFRDCHWTTSGGPKIIFPTLREMAAHFYTCRDTQVITQTLFHGHAMHIFEYRSGKVKKHDFFENDTWIAKIKPQKSFFEIAIG